MDRDGFAAGVRTTACGRTPSGEAMPPDDRRTTGVFNS
jgi:hypothetical protein